MKKKVKAFVKSTSKKMAYVLAGIIIFAALLVAVSRSLTPLLSRYRPELETWATQVLGQPVTIQKVHVTWYQYQPGISLGNVTLLNKDSKQPVLQIKEIRVFFSIPRSIWTFSPVTSGVLLSGTAINLYETDNGEIVLQGFPAFGGFNNEPYKSETKAKDIMAWLSMQRRLVVNNIDIKYKGINGLKRYVTLYNLSFTNGVNKHTILGKAILHQALPTEVNVAVQWIGNDVDLTKIRARIYLYVSGLSISQWIKGLSWHGWEITDGAGSAKIWANWHDNAIQKVQTTFEMYDLTLLSAKDNSIHKITRMSGEVGWKRDGQNQIVAGNDILIDLPTHLWPTTNFYLLLTPNQTNALDIKALNVGFVDIDDIETLLQSSTFIPEDALHTIANLHPQGSIQNASATFEGKLDDLTTTTLDANISRLSFSAWQKFPGVQNISGDLKWNKTQGSLQLNSNQFVFTDNSIFENPIGLDQLTGNISIHKNDKQEWMLETPDLQMMNNDLAANVNGSFTLPQNSLPIANIKANFTLQQAKNISKYLPMKTYKPNLALWLHRSFLGGEVKSGTAILRGPLQSFPFDDNSGLFQISGYVNNVNLKFAPDWPEVDKIAGLLTFTNRSMQVQVDKAEILSIPVANIKAEIPYLGDKQPPVLTIQSDSIKTDFQKAVAVIHQSPLEKTIGKVFHTMSVLGPLDLKLTITIPLDDADRTQVQGNASVNNILVNLVPWRLAVANVSGDVRFTEKTLQAQLQGLLFNKPAQIQLSTIQKDNATVIRANLKNHVNLSDIEAWLKVPFSKYVQGDTDVATTVDLSFDKPTQIYLQSDLQGIAVDLPDEYGKKAVDKMLFSAALTIAEKQPLKILLDYGKLFNAAVILNVKDESYALNAANIRFGEGIASWPSTPGLYISGELDSIDWQKLSSYNTEDNSAATLLPLKNIDVKFKKINLGAQVLSNARIQVVPANTDYNVTIDSDDIAGQIQLPKKITRKSNITAQFSHFNYQSASKNVKAPAYISASPAIDVKTLPAISVTANNVRYNGSDIGQIIFKASPQNDGLSIDSLQITSNKMDFQSSGTWFASGTNLHGNVSSTKVSDLIGSFGFDVHNFVANKGGLGFDLTWNGSPFSLDAASLNGSARLALGEGRIVDIGQNSGAKMDLGRLLSIFSLQTIPRRLSLDFSDVFEKGYSFDSLKGDFNIKNGNIYTDNLRFEGPVAKVSIDGRIGLKDKDLNLVLTVNAHVTSSIPVAATLLTGQPLIGLAALAVNTVIGSQMSKAAATYYYEVTGTWDKPSWKPITNRKK